MTVAAAQRPREEEPEDPRIRAERLKGKHLIDESILAEGIRLSASTPMKTIKSSIDPAFVDSALEILAMFKRG